MEKLLTNIEHDMLWRDAFSRVPQVAHSLRAANAIAIIKELYEVGEIEKDDYIRSLYKILNSEGYHKYD